MKKIVFPLTIILILIFAAVGLLKTKEIPRTDLMKLQAAHSSKKSKVVDHSKFAILNKKFNSPVEVTSACITCHTERHKEIMKSNHWNWETPEYVEGEGIVYLGKKNALNNFCLGVGDDQAPCAKCHIGYGMDNPEFSYDNPEQVDCLICHDNTETYAKAQDKGGAPVETLDLNLIAQNVGDPKRSNCGVCHFYGGGGDNVKHGDLGSEMFSPDKSIDIHMATEGMNMECTTCHKTENHMISGKMYSISSSNLDRAYCEDCHSDHPHKDKVLDQHTLKVACQTCHIPTYAKGKATKLTWDWSTAGKLKDGKPYEEDNEDGNHTYLSKKGTFTYGKNLKPEYIFFNGTANHYLLGDVVKDTTIPLVINKLNGSYSDINSKIIPVKIHKSNQPFDPVNKMLIKPKLWADKPGEGAYWMDFDWIKASELGMKTVGLPFSGRVSFIETEMYWPVNHQVAAKEDAVKCNECHTQENSRLANLEGFYMPARDRSEIIDTTGKLFIILSFVGIMIHSGVRYASNRKHRRGNNEN